MGVDYDGFNAFGKPVPVNRLSAARKHLRAMGVSDNGDAWECIGQMAKAIERDEPYEAMEAGKRFVDLTGVYRIMAVLCTDGAGCAEASK